MEKFQLEHIDGDKIGGIRYQSVPRKDDRLRLTAMIFRLFQLWKINDEAQPVLLGLPPKNKQSFSKYMVEKGVPNSPDVLDRVGHLLSIHKSLRMLYKHDLDLAYTWVTCPNRAFDGKSPLSVMMTYRFAGLLRVKAYLDRACIN